MMLNYDCRFKRTIKAKTCTGICTSCEHIKTYKELLNKGKIDIIDDLANFRTKEDNKNGTKSNKRNKKRTISKSRAKSKKSNKMEKINE